MHHAIDGLGFAETTMAEVLGAVSQSASLELQSTKGAGKAAGTVCIRMDEVEHQHDLVTLKLRAAKVSRL